MDILNVFCIKENNKDFFVEEALTVPFCEKKVNII